MVKWWMVRAGDENELIPSWIEKKVASIGWSELGDPSLYNSRDTLIRKCDQVYSDEKSGTRIQWGSQVWKFSHVIQLGDKIVTYSRETREYLVGTVTREHEFNPQVIDDYYPNIIGVKWEAKRIPRDLLSQGAKNSLGGISTVFRIDQWADEFESLLQGTEFMNDPKEDDNDDIVHTSEDFIYQIKSMVEDKVDKLDPWQMQELVAGVLQAMGYKVQVSPKGRDGGVDILAHRDAFGFEQPIIKVQVKHRKTSTSGPEVQQLMGTHPFGASCLFVSTGGFTSAAYSIAQQHGVKLLDLSGLVELLLEWYEKMQTERQSLVPLKKMYVPI